METNWVIIVGMILLSLFLFLTFIFEFSIQFDRLNKYYRKKTITLNKLRFLFFRWRYSSQINPRIKIGIFDKKSKARYFDESNSNSISLVSLIYEIVIYLTFIVLCTCIFIGYLYDVQLARLFIVIIWSVILVVHVPLGAIIWFAKEKIFKK
ncbi:hypothetical protein RJI07_08650 [Mycoplasmatota bacterium WC30]